VAGVARGGRLDCGRGFVASGAICRIKAALIESWRVGFSQSGGAGVFPAPYFTIGGSGRLA